MANQAWQSAWVEVLPDLSNFQKTANKEMTGILGTAGDNGGRRAGSGISSGIVGGITGALALGALSVAGDIGRAIGDAIGTGINFALDGIDLASDLAESSNAIKVTFGESADGIAALGEDAATRLGLTQNAFNGIATQFSASATTIVGEGGNVVGLIDELTTRGSDFASVYNLDVAEALGLFQSGLAGETEPLRKFGIDLSAASVNAFAAANGIGALGTELTEAEKVQARYGLLMQQTNATAGDFANTSGGLAGQQKILAASFEEAQTNLGTALLPAMTSLTTLANDELIPALTDLIDEVGPVLSDALIESLPAFQELISAITPLIPELVKLAVEALPPFLDFLVLVSPLIIDWVDNQALLLAGLTGLFDLISGDTTLEELGLKLLGMGGSLQDTIESVVTFALDFQRNFENIRDGVFETLGNVVQTALELPGKILAGIGALGTTLFSSGQDLINGFINGVKDKATSIAKAALKVVTDAVNGVKDFLGIASPSKLFAELGGFVGEGFIQGIDGQAAGVSSAMQSLVAIPAIGGSGLALAGSSGATAAAGGGFNNYGTIQVTDEAALVDEVEKRKRRAYALAGLNGVKVA